MTQGKHCWALPSVCSMLRPNGVYREAWSIPDNCTGVSFGPILGLFFPKARGKKKKEEKKKKGAFLISFPIKERKF